MKAMLGLFSIFLCISVALGDEPTNYTKLEKRCQASTTSGCCLASAREMRFKQYPEAKDGKCEEGWTVNTYRCTGSLAWCEPLPAADIAVNGGGIRFEKRTVVEKREQD